MHDNILTTGGDDAVRGNLCAEYVPGECPDPEKNHNSFFFSVFRFTAQLLPWGRRSLQLRASFASRRSCFKTSAVISESLMCGSLAPVLSPQVVDLCRFSNDLFPSSDYNARTIWRRRTPYFLVNSRNVLPWLKRVRRLDEDAMHNEMKLKQHSYKTVLNMFCFSFISSCGQLYRHDLLSFHEDRCQSAYTSANEIYAHIVQRPLSLILILEQ